MKLYDLSLSGNCYKVRLFAALAGIPLEIVAVDFLSGEHKRPPLSDLNPWCEIPILVDGDVVLRDSQAILVYLAGRYGGEQWLPKDPAGMPAQCPRPVTPRCMACATSPMRPPLSRGLPAARHVRRGVADFDVPPHGALKDCHGVQGDPRYPRYD